MASTSTFTIPRPIATDPDTPFDELIKLAVKTLGWKSKLNKSALSILRACVPAAYATLERSIYEPTTLRDNPRQLFDALQALYDARLEVVRYTVGRSDLLITVRADLHNWVIPVLNRRHILTGQPVTTGRRKQLVDALRICQRLLKARPDKATPKPPEPKPPSSVQPDTPFDRHGNRRRPRQATPPGSHRPHRRRSRRHTRAA